MFFVNYERGQGPWKHNIDPQAIIRKLSPYITPDKSGFLAKDRILLIQALHWNTPSSLLEPAPLYHAPSEIAVVSWARIDNGEELGEALDISHAAFMELSDSDLILRSYLKWGEDCVLHLIGDFSFVIYDRKKETLFCGRDHMGVRPFYYFLSSERFVCATSLAALVQPGCVPIEPDEQWICEYLCGLSMSWDRTPYKGIHKLPPAHVLIVAANGRELRQYFQLSDVKELKLEDSREYVEAYREELERAVKCRLRTNYALGSELSGGLDSSTVTTYAAKFLDRPLTHLHAFAFTNCELEPRYIEEVRRAYQLPHVHLFTNQGSQPEEKYQRSVAILGYPVEMRIASFHEPFYRVAEELNVRTLLSGFGGDEFVTTIFGYLALHELLRKRRYGDLYRILPGNALFRLLRLIKQQLKEVQSLCFDTPAYNPLFYEPYFNRLPHLLVHKDLAIHYSLTDRYLDQAKFDTGYADLKRFTLEQCWQPSVPSRLETCTLMAAARKIEYRWPLLDVRLISFFLNVPSEEHYYRGMGRYLHRRAVMETVPELVAWKPSKDMGNIVDGLGGNRPEVFSVENLHPELAKWIDLQKLDDQLAEAPHSAPWDDKSWQIQRNLNSIVYLDTWMKQYSDQLGLPKSR